MNKTDEAARKLSLKNILKSRKGYSQAMKSQGADDETLEMLNANPKKAGFGEDAIYNEMSKIPLSEQMDMMKVHNSERNDSIKESNEEYDNESHDEKRKRMLRNMFGTQGVS